METDINVYKIIVIGDIEVGKAAYIQGVVDGHHNPGNHRPLIGIGIDFKRKTLTINNKEIKLQIWDIAGQERFQSMINIYCRATKGVILIYSITEQYSFTSLVRNYKNMYKSFIDENNITAMLIGNNCENENLRQVSRYEAESFALENNMLFF